MSGKRELPRRRWPLLLVLTVIAAALLVRLFLPSAAPSSEETPAPAETVTAPEETEKDAETLEATEAAEDAETVEDAEATRFVLSLLGDCTLSSSHYTNHFESVVGDDLSYPFSNVADILTADDLTLANLECSFSSRRLESESEYAFCGQPKYAQSLVLGGVDCVTMANNHTYDFGTTGVADTAAVLEAAGLSGLQGDQGTCFELVHEDGTALRVGIYVHPFNGSASQMKQGTARLREEGADLVIACMHAGAERIYVPTTRQTSLAHAAIDGGADIVVGTHPHILQPAEEYKGGVILYSIGNFCFGGNRDPSDKDTVIAQVIAEVTEEGVSWEMAYIPCGISSVSTWNDYRPTPYAQDSTAYQRCLSKLVTPWDPTTAEEAAAQKAAEAAAETGTPGAVETAGAAATEDLQTAADTDGG